MFIFPLWKRKRMEWKHDPSVQEAIRNYLINQKDDLNQLLISLDNHADRSPPFQFLRVFGMFIFRYSDNIKNHTEIDAWDLTIAEVSNDPAVQSMVGKMMNQQLDRGMGLHE